VFRITLLERRVGIVRDTEVRAASGGHGSR
jgi:hypothetical protein